ncbi:MAG: hypothetical protein ABFS03_12875 [Chloroflexota bacterium]
MKAMDKKVSKYFPDPAIDDLSSHAHRQLIGMIGLVLPHLLWLIAGWRLMKGLQRWELLSSISAYYYTGAVAVFSGALVALAVFLFSYRGYDNQQRRRDRIAANIAGAAAILVAFFPTDVPKGFPALSWWTPIMGTIHYVSAVILFSSFIFFSLFLFPISKLEKEELPPDKLARNRIYISCGVAIVLCIIWAFIAVYNDAPIFWPEALALEFFAISWLVKGRVDKTAAAAGKQTLQYVRDPRQMVDDVKKSIRGTDWTPEQQR